MSRPDRRATHRALARIRSLCCLGLGGEIMVPQLLREVCAVIPSPASYFRWIGPDFAPVKTYSPDEPVSSVEHYLKEFHYKGESTLVRSVAETHRAPLTRDAVNYLQQVVKVEPRAYFRSDLYNVVMKPSGRHDMIALRIRQAGRPLGSLCVGRAAHDPPFAPGDYRLLESIAGFIAHGMARAPDIAPSFVDDGDHGLLLATPDGRVQHASDRGRHLLALALDPSQSRHPTWPNTRGPVPDLARLCKCLLDVASGEAGQPPLLHRRNPWGEFILRAYWLEPTDGTEPTRHVAITIKQRVPRTLAAWRRVEELPLTGQEKWFCLLLARDPARKDFADAMGVSPATTTTHLRNIFTKLDVHSRAELVAVLQPH